MMYIGLRHYYCSSPAAPSTHDLHQKCQLGDKLEKLQASGPDKGALRTPHAHCCQGAAGMGGQGALAALRRRNLLHPASPDARLAAGHCLAIRPFLAVLTREAREFPPASVPLHLRRPPSNVEQFASDRAPSRLSRCPRQESGRAGVVAGVVAGVASLQGLLPGEQHARGARGHDMSDSIAVTRAARHSMRSPASTPAQQAHACPSRVAVQGSCARLLFGLHGPPMPVPRSLFVTPIWQESTRSLESLEPLEPSRPYQACTERHSIPGCHGGRLLSIPGPASCTAKQNAHWLSHKIFREKPARLDCCKPFNIA